MKNIVGRKKSVDHLKHVLGEEMIRFDEEVLVGSARRGWLRAWTP